MIILPMFILLTQDILDDLELLCLLIKEVWKVVEFLLQTLDVVLRSPCNLHNAIPLIY